MELLFWASVGLIVYAYLGYPLVLWGWGKVRGKTPQRSEVTPKVTLLIAAYNEEAVIAEKIENSLALDYPHEQLEIVVASESTDNTNAIVKRFAARGVKLRAYAPRRGKAATLCSTVPQVEGEIVVFSDANALYHRDALRKLVGPFADPRIGCVSGRLEYVSRAADSAAASESLYWRYEMCVKRLESRLFSLLGANGSIFALRKQLYAPLSETRGDDFELPVCVRLRGSGAILEPEAVSREKGAESTQAEFRRRVRIVAWNLVSALWLAKEALRGGAVLILFQLVSHKLLRWLAPLFLITLLLSSAALDGMFYAVAWGSQLLFYALAAAGWVLEARRTTLPKLLRLPYHFCALHLAALVGVGRLATAAAPATWEKVR